MKVRYATPEEIAHWNHLIESNPDGGNMLQSIEWAELKATLGWKIHYLITDLCAITVHERLIPGLGKLWYIPKGPGLTNLSDLAALKKPLQKFAETKGVFVIKTEIEVVKNSTDTHILTKKGFVKTRSVQPSSGVFLDLTPSPEEIMTALPQNARHAIKRAFRDGIRIEKVEPTEKNFAIMYQLMGASISGGPMLLRTESYYRSYWKSYSDSGQGAFFFAYNRKKPIAGAFVILLGKKATYKDGGSTNDKPIYGMSHALQWTIIEWLKTKGMTNYDLGLTPPADKINDPTHPSYGVGRFKTGFNKTVTEFIGVYDIPVRPKAYKLWATVGERAIKRFYAQVLKQYFY